MSSAVAVPLHSELSNSVASPRAESRVASEPPKALDFHNSPAGADLQQRADAALSKALENTPEYRWKDVTNEWHQAHAMGRQRADFEVKNAGRDLDADWKQGRSNMRAVEAFSEHADEAAMNAGASKAYQAAREAGRGPQWLEAFNLGKEQALRRAEFDGITRAAETGAKLLAKDVAGLITEGPVGEAMLVRDMAQVAMRAPTMGEVVAGSAAGAAAMTVAAGLVKEHVESTAAKLGISEKDMPALHALNQALAPAGRALDSFHEGVQGLIRYGDAKIDQVGHAVSSMAEPITKPLENLAHHASKAAEPYTAPAAHALGEVFKPVGDALGRAVDSVLEVRDRMQARVGEQAALSALEHFGKVTLTSEEAHLVLKELAHVQKGDTLVVENHAIHIVPAGTKMPEFSPDARKLDADALRELAGIPRAPNTPDNVHSQPPAQHGRDR